MRQIEQRVVEMAALGGLVRVTCVGPEPGAEPGQFCLARAGAASALLRHPVFPFPGPEGGSAFYVPAVHALARLQPGDPLDLIGPCGRGFRLPASAGNLLVLAGDLGRLLPVIDAALGRGLAVTALTPRSANLLPSDVEIHRGPVTAELAAWADVIVLDVRDPQARAQHLRSMAPPRGPDFIQALITPPIPCGTGACHACWVQPAQGRGPRLACVDGPVFSL